MFITKVKTNFSMQKENSMMMMTADGNDMSNWDCDCHLLPTKVKTSLISSELPLFAEKPVLVASLAMAGPQTNLKRSTFHFAN